jgi:hypothetical protein
MRLKLLTSMLILLLPVISEAQRKADIGIFAGTAYYMGDINPNRHFYRPSFSLGGIYRYNFNKRYALRLNGIFADLSGNDLDFPGRLNPDRPASPANFQTSILDVAAQLEFNFLPYMPTKGIGDYSPYIAVGFAEGFIVGSNVDAINVTSFLFGIGGKINITSRLSAGDEWSFRKTFNDHLDGISNPSGTSAFMHNNDWYSLLGVFITFKFFNFANECPAYD